MKLIESEVGIRLSLSQNHVTFHRNPYLCRQTTRERSVDTQYHPFQVSVKDQGGFVKILLEEPEDLWPLYNILANGDLVRASTVRKVPFSPPHTMRIPSVA